MTVELMPWCDQAPLVGYLQALNVSPLAPVEKGKEIKSPLMLHASLALSLQQAVAQEVGLEEAVAAWQEAAERLAGRHRRQRSGTLLVSLEAALAAPEALRQALERKELSVSLAEDVKPVRLPVEPFYLLLAEHLIHHRQELKAQMRLLEALSLPLGDDGPDSGAEDALDIDAALQTHLEGQDALDERSSLTETLRQTQDEQQSLQEENFQLLEQQRRQAEEQQKAVTRHKQEAEKARKEASEHQGNVKVLEDENTLLLEQLHLVQEEFERLVLEQRAEHEEQVLATLSPREQQLKRLRESEWFDTDWYLAQYRDVRESGVDPVEHYLLCGARLGRDPGPCFDTRAYLTRYPDVAATEMNPLYHFVLHGQAENRNPGRLESGEA